MHPGLQQLEVALNDVSECLVRWTKQIDDSRDVRFRALARAMAAIESVVPQGHAYRVEAQKHCDKVHGGDPREQIYGFAGIKGVLQALVAEYTVTVPAISDPTAPILADLQKLIAQVPAMREEILNRGDYAGGSEKQALWVQKATSVIATHFGKRIASDFRNITYWGPPTQRSIRDFDKSVGQHLSFIQNLSDEVRRDPDSYGASSMTNSTPIISITYSPQEFELVQQWAAQQNAQIAFAYNAGATFKEMLQP